MENNNKRVLEKIIGANEKNPCKVCLVAASCKSSCDKWRMFIFSNFMVSECSCTPPSKAEEMLDEMGLRKKE